ncbi:hypothetical protein AWB76_00939 [Caballeronia temeraria]|uniref:Portal protein n=1 Tax=Caballeronia temeraria TaxID=1777137 RepID=A0A157ZM34_9BURK|nr:hypothetical protein [Caballeronia temeraria]SAK46584.1 hypothetical protein AWB76_00939 [Caballeronia temeraria]
MAKRTKQSPPQIIAEDTDQEAVKQQLENQLRTLLPGVLPEQDDQQGIHASVDLTSKSKRKTEEEVLAVVNQLEMRAKDHVRNRIMHRATKTLEYFYAQPEGDFSVSGEGRSDFVDSSVADTVRWIETGLVDAFCGTNDIVDFVARNSASDRAAEMTKAMVNYVWQQNDGYEVMRAWINDALLTPGGVIKIFWEPDGETKTELYEGVSDLEYAAIALSAEMGECIIVSHDTYPNPQLEQLTMLQHGLALAGANASGIQSAPVAPQVQQQAQAGVDPMQVAQQTQIDPQLPAITQTLHDVKIAILPDPKRGSIKIINVPLDEFYVDPSARRIKDAKYAAHVSKKTISELRAMGFDDDKLDDLNSTEDNPELTELYLARNRMDQANAFDFAVGTYDESLREVEVVEAYLLMDYDGDGFAEWRKIVKAGNTILLNEPCDGNPFCVMVSVPISHTLFGLSVGELAMNVQKQNTNLVRSLIDNVSFGANAAIWFDENKVDMTFVQDVGPGSMVPVDGDGNESIGVVPSSSGDIAAVVQLLEMFDTIKQERTGVQKLTRGNDADVVNETATGYMQMTDRAEEREKLVARHFAETGVKPAVLRIKQLLAEHPDQKLEIRLNGQTMEADPLDARANIDLIPQVGLGTGDKGRTLASLQQVMALQMQAMQMHTGMVDLNLIYNTAERIVKALGVSNVGEFVHKPPSPMPQVPPPHVSPDMQMQMQLETVKAQANQQQQERQAQLDAMRIQAQAKTDNEQRHMDFQYKMQLLEKQKEIEQLKAILAISAQREQAAFQAGVSPEAEQAMFNETFSSTEEAYKSALTGINMHMSGEMDDLINTIAQAPDPTEPDVGPQQ